VTVTVAAAQSAPRARRATLALLEDVFGEIRTDRFAVRLWDGTEWGSSHAGCTLVLAHPGALRTMLLRPSELSLGEAFVFGDVDVEGELEAVFPVAEQLLERDRGLAERARLAQRLLALPRRPRPHDRERYAARLHGRRHALRRDRQAVAYHYDVSNDFYTLFLDRNLVYSCAYFSSARDSLDEAQERKVDLICRKLGLREGERLLDIGCGWGGLLLHAAAHYGVEAVGITLSRAQAELARERVASEGLEDRCRVEIRDYRELPAEPRYDKVVSVGMFEHVGERQLPTYFRRTWTLLRPGGLFLNHGIARPLGQTGAAGPSFRQRYVFPDGELAPISATIGAAEAAGFELCDIESLREHYTLTLRHWVRRLEAQAEEARRTAGEVAYRIWRLYMAAGAHRFATNQLSVYQTLFAKPDRGASGVPLTRGDWYR
jgi:cyclopropane-fatty-acyl-phospholipid synthase